MNYLSICAILKDENIYLPEWIAYHRAVGVEHFYLYDNESSVAVASTLASEVAARRATVTPFYGRARQLPAYLDCSLRRAHESRWIAFIDVDEFIVPKRSDDLRSILEGYEQFAALGINWQTFGSNGHLSRPAGLQIEAFTRRAARFWGPNAHIKSIVQPGKVASSESPHHFFYRESHCVNETRGRIEGPFNRPILFEAAQINHYLIRSVQESRDKAARGSADGGKKPQDVLDSWDRECNEEEDRDILRFAEATKKLIL